MSCPSFHLSPSRPRWFWWMESNADPPNHLATKSRDTMYVYRLPFFLLVSGMVAKYRLKLTIELVKAVYYATGIVPQVGLFVCLFV